MPRRPHTIANARADVAYAKRLLEAELKKEDGDENKMTPEEEEKNETYIKMMKSSVKTALKSVSSLRKNNEYRKKMSELKKKYNSLKKAKSTAYRSKNDDLIEQAKKDHDQYVENLKVSADNTAQMLTAAEPIMDTFDELLTRPYIDEFNASVDCDPIMGWRKEGSQFKIVYMHYEQQQSSFKPVWKVFDDFPSGSNPNDNSKVFFFPHRDKLILSVDGSLWSLRSTGQADTSKLNEAVNDYRKMFDPNWQAISGGTLPIGTVNVFTYAEFEDDSDAVHSWCVSLTSSGKFMALDSDQFLSSQWFELKPKTRDDSRDWKCAAPQDGFLAAYAKSQSADPGNGDCIFWLAVDMDKETYSIESSDTRRDSAPIRDSFLSCNVDGLVSERRSGELHQRVISTAGGSSTSTEYEWKFLINIDDVKSIGFASAAVLADLRMVIQRFRSRYRDVQSVIMNTNLDIISATYLNDLFLNDDKKNARSYEQGTLDNIQGVTALHIQRVRAISQIMGDAVRDSQEQSADLQNELLEIEIEMNLQIAILEDELGTLNNVLDDLNAQKKKMTGGLIFTIVGLVLSVAAVVVFSRYTKGKAKKWLTRGAGTFALGFAVSLVAVAMSLAELSRTISQTEQQIESCTNSIEDLEEIIVLFSDISEGFAAIAEYWSQTLIYCNNLETSADLLFDFADIYLDPLVIQSCIENNTALGANSTAYNQMLARQGITTSNRSQSVTTHQIKIIDDLKACAISKDHPAYLAYAQEVEKIKNRWNCSIENIPEQQEDMSAKQMVVELSRKFENLMEKMEKSK